MTTANPQVTDGGRAPTVAVLVRCFNEEVTIGRVVQDFRRVLPDATVYVYDNNSTDATADEARAVVRSCGPRRCRARATWCSACSPT